MTRLPITSGADNTILRTVSAAVQRVDKKLEQLIRDMKVTMDIEEGIGIAASQVGVNLRLALVRLNPSTDHEMTITMINPEILDHSDVVASQEEGCLSLRGKWGSVPRYTKVTVEFFDKKMKRTVLQLEGLNARIAQHEIDHLNGMLFIDRVEGSVREE